MPNSNFDTPRAFAATYVSLGLGGVLRLLGKLPAGQGGPGQIGAALWTFDEIDALAGWNGDLGIVPAPGMLVLDIDVKNGARGEETLAEWLAEAGPLPSTLECRTPSGGRHIWLEYHGPRPKGGDGIDVRTYGSGYVAVPPSAGYEWNTRTLDREPSEVSSSWAEFLAARRAHIRKPPSDGGDSTGRSHESDEDREVWEARQDDAVEKTLRWYRRRGWDV